MCSDKNNLNNSRCTGDPAERKIGGGGPRGGKTAESEMVEIDRDGEQERL